MEAITSPDGLHALKLTLLTVVIAVPLNTIFGVICSLLLVRHKWKGNWLIDAVINLPFAISPVVIGLSLFLLYGKQGWFEPGLAEAGIKILFSTPGIVLACIFVSRPLRRPRDGAGAAGDRHRTGAGGGDARRQRLADLLAGHPAGDPLGRRLWRRPLHRPRARRVRRRLGRLRKHLRGNPDAAPLRREELRELQPPRRLRRRRPAAHTSFEPFSRCPSDGCDS